MTKIYFKFNEHPGDFLRNTDVIELPNPKGDLENFLVQFLKHYQSDEKVTYLDDLYKLLDNDFFEETDKNKFINFIGNKTESEIKNEIKLVENELINEAYQNFYNLIQTNKIQIIENDKK
ncbi:hypothetical protein MQX03_05560 [Chryseobacterium aahli]|uniref:hypothetical protein n=1 Tax=Chryseobacterium aahli TaxID=1278643 RepID=UPI001F608F7E|nr:hypothetical protein [Chryseobacterium aahli]MCI3936655.1 hypothetical protein [Chryseobacterium aahli]